MTAQSAYQTYVETSVTVSDPLELTRMLYRGAIQSISSARRALTMNDVPQRAASLSKAQQIVAELISSLDADRGAELAHRLAQIYDYVLHLLQKGNFERQDAPLAEAERLLGTLLQAWESPSLTAPLPDLSE